MLKRQQYYFFFSLFFSLTLLIACQPGGSTDTTLINDPGGQEKGPFFTVDTIVPPDTTVFPDGPFGEMVRYGRELIIHTPKYIGPKGSAGSYTKNYMTCKNCHMDGGTRNFGINFMTTYGRYPQYRSREGNVLTIEQRINNCVERPHSGIPLPLDSREMVAIVSYLKWCNEGNTVGKRMNGDAYLPFEWPEEEADRENGKKVYILHCETCHQADGQGLMLPDSSEYQYPPLWGKFSYQPGSSMHRVTKAALFIKSNMPYGTHWSKPVLTDKECVDVAAYINDDSIHERPVNPMYDVAYPLPEYKPIGFDRGPYLDPYPDKQHKYGPYAPIIRWYEKNGKKFSL